jgi:hypothetical protein
VTEELFAADIFSRYINVSFFRHGGNDANVTYEHNGKSIRVAK